MRGPNLVIQRVPDRAAYRLPFHVRVPARASADLLERQRSWSIDRMRTELHKQGWEFVTLEPGQPRGPFPVVPVKGFGRRPVKVRRKPGQASAPEQIDDSLWRVSTLPTFGPQAAHLLTDEVEWEYVAIFQRPIIPTAAEEAPPDA